jgi:hypothetical protein
MREALQQWLAYYMADSPPSYLACIHAELYCMFNPYTSNYYPEHRIWLLKECVGWIGFAEHSLV